MAEKEDTLKIPAVQEVEMIGTEKFGVSRSEIDRTMDIGDVTDITFRGELVEKRDDIWIYRKVGPAQATGDVDEMTTEEMRRSLPKADR